MIVIAELLGIPSSDRPTFRRWADTLFDQANIEPDDSLQKVGEEAVASVAPTIREMNAYLLDYIRSRRANPGQDLTSKLLQAEVDGERLDDQEIVGFVGLLLLAGHITTTATLGNAIVSFEEHPDGRGVFFSRRPHQCGLIMLRFLRVCIRAGIQQLEHLL